MRMTGTIHSFSETDRCGFIAADSGGVCYVHIIDIDKNLSPTVGTEVAFDIIYGPKGRQAINVKAKS